MKRVKLALGAALVFGLGSVALAVWIGASVREDTIVEKPYEEGLRQDAERAARKAAALSLALEDEAPRAGAGPLAFRLLDSQGRAVAGARVGVELSRAETGRGELRAAAREVAPGRYTADVAFPAAGPWDVRVDVAQGGADRVRLERRVVATAACDLAAGPCSAPVAGGREVTLELGPRPLRTMQDLSVRVEVRGIAVRPERSAAGGGAESKGAESKGAESKGAESKSAESKSAESKSAESKGAESNGEARASVSFRMPGMEMGENRTALAPAGPDAWTGKAVLVRCPSGRRDWIAELTLPGAPPLRFPFTVPEGR